MSGTSPDKLYTSHFGLLCLSGFLFFAGFNMVIPELPDYLESLGGSDYKGLIISLFTLTAGLSRPFSGKLTDKIGRVPVMIYGALVSALAALCYPFVSSIIGFLALRFFHGMSTGFKPTGTAAYVADIVPVSRRGEGTGLLGLCSGIGMAAGPYLGSEVTSIFSLNTMFYCSSALAILSILVLFGIKETLTDREPFQAKHLKVRQADFLEPLVFPTALVMLLNVYSFGMLLTVTPEVGRLFGFTNKGTYFSAFITASIAVRFIGGKASDKFGRTPVLMASSGLIVTALISTGLAQNQVTYLIGAAIYGLGIGLNHPTVMAWTIDLSSPQHKGRAFATMYIALEVGIGLGAFISGTYFSPNKQGFLLNCLIAAGFAGSALIYLLKKQLTYAKHTS